MVSCCGKLIFANLSVASALPCQFETVLGPSFNTANVFWVSAIETPYHYGFFNYQNSAQNRNCPRSQKLVYVCILWCAKLMLMVISIFVDREVPSGLSMSFFLLRDFVKFSSWMRNPESLMLDKNSESLILDKNTRKSHLG